jgi:hypothetical protein
MLDLEQFSAPIAEILELHEGGNRLIPLAPEAPLSGTGLDRLRSTSSDELFAGTPVASRAFADCVRSGLFLYLSALDDSHKISQEISSTSGSYWHGIMHRQEPDYGNSKYWFRRVGQHEIFPELRTRVLDELQAHAESLSVTRAIEANSNWDPFWFVDTCEQACREPNGELHRLALEIQRLEWQILFDYCYRKALSG